MSKKEFFLSREYLIESKKSTPTNDIKVHDFKSSVISLSQIEKASLIVFCESLYDGKGTHGNSQRVLKDRTGNYFKNLTFKEFNYHE
jgi:hypothetical protein